MHERADHRLAVPGPRRAGGAQELPGLDLSAPPQAEERKPKPAGREPRRSIPASPPPRPAEAGQPAAAPAGGTLFGERDVALGDRVKAVQRKGFLKRGRFEVAPILALSVNDAFYQKVGGGLRLAYSLQDSFAVAVRGAYYTPFRTDNVPRRQAGLPEPAAHLAALRAGHGGRRLVARSTARPPSSATPSSTSTSSSRPASARSGAPPATRRATRGRTRPPSSAAASASTRRSGWPSSSA